MEAMEAIEAIEAIQILKTPLTLAAEQFRLMFR
jgi:hypothetical protein